MNKPSNFCDVDALRLFLGDDTGQGGDNIEPKIEGKIFQSDLFEIFFRLIWS